MRGRKPIQHRLPPLAKVFPGFRGLREDENKQQRIRELLLAGTRPLRRSQARPYYSMREVARFFGVAVPTAAKAYAALQHDGLLRRVRGSHTVLAARSARPQVPVRGVVALPVYLPNFIYFADVRRFYIRLEDHLRQQEFLADFIFFEQAEDWRPTFLPRLLQHHPDCVIWLIPLPLHRSILNTIRDSGIPVVVIADTPTFSPALYRLNWEHGLERALQAWQAAGIRRLEVPRALPAHTSATHVLEPVAARLQLPLVTAPIDWHQPLASFWAGLGRSPETGVVLDDDLAAHYLYSTDAREFVGLLRRGRVLAMRPLDLPLSLCDGARVDLLAMQWDKLAGQIARDFATGQHLRRSEPVAIKASWQPQVPIASFQHDPSRDAAV